MEMLAVLGTFGKNIVGIKAPYFDGTQPCSQTDPEIFFPEVDTSRDVIKTAKNICNSCEFKEPCIEYAIITFSVGIWGGTTDRERQVTRRLRKKKAAL